MRTRKWRKLTDTPIARMRPREQEYAVWHSSVQGLLIPVRPNRLATN